MATCENKMLRRQVASLQQDRLAEKESVVRLVKTFTIMTRVVEAKIAKLQEVCTLKLSE